MSAYMVSEAHINALVDVALRGPRDPSVPVGAVSLLSLVDASADPVARVRDWSELRYRWQGRDVRVTLDGTGGGEISALAFGRLLIAENARSMRARYGTRAEEAVEGCEADYALGRPHRSCTAIEALKAIDCLDYQSCETKDWTETEAHAALAALVEALIVHLPGYDGAPWGCPDDADEMAGVRR